MGALDEMEMWPAEHSAGVVLTGGTTPRGTLGHPRVVERRGDLDRRYPWASISKLTTTLAILVAVEEGTVALTDSVGPVGSTLNHLLAHASGLGPTNASALMQPGRRRIYSNLGFDVAGGWLARRSGMSFVEYLDEAVLSPLGIEGGVGMRPSTGMVGSIDELARLAAEFMQPTLISQETLDAATTVAFPALYGVLPGFGRHDPCDWGTGFEVRSHKHPHWTGSNCSPATFGHFGQVGSFLWCDPVAGVSCCVLTDLDFGPWAIDCWPHLADTVLAAHGPYRTKQPAL